MGVTKQKKITIVERPGRGFVVEYRDQDGKRPRPAFKTRVDAERFRAQLLGLQPKPEPLNLGDESKTLKFAIKQYMQTEGHGLSAKGKCAARSHFTALFLWLANEARITRLDEISLMHLDQFKAQLLTGTRPKHALPESVRVPRALSPNSVRRMFATYSPFFNKCIAWGLIAKSPMQGLKKPSEIESNIKTWSREQVEHVLSALPDWASDAAFFMERTGCRVVDIERLTWADIDLEKQTMQLKSFKGGAARIDVLPIPQDLSQFLESRHNAEGPLKGSLVFTTNRGGPVTADSLQKAVRRVAGALGYEGLTAYGLRHTFADSLVDLGVHPRDIQLLMRHRKFETTTRYTKRKNDHLSKIVADRSQVVTTRKSGHKLGHKVGHNTNFKLNDGTKFSLSNQEVKIGAGERARTVDLYLGKESDKAS